MGVDQNIVNTTSYVMNHRPSAPRPSCATLFIGAVTWLVTPAGRGAAQGKIKAAGVRGRREEWQEWSWRAGGGDGYGGGGSGSFGDGKERKGG